MADKIEQFLRSSTGSAIAAKLGLVVPDLKRYQSGNGLPTGAVVVAGGRGEAASRTLRAQLDTLGLNCVEVTGTDPSSAFPECSNDKCDALIYDGRDCSTASDLSRLHHFFSPMVRRLNNNGRILVIAEPHKAANSPERAAAQRALEGFTRSLAKEVGNRGSTAQLMIIEPGADAATRSTLAYLLSVKSAYIDGQVIPVRAGATLPATPGDKPLAEKVVIVTGAARGIGEAISRVLAREGARIVGVDIPPSAEAIAWLAHPESAAVNGVTLRVCGQNWLGA